MRAGPECSLLLARLPPGSRTSGGLKVSFQFSSGFWPESERQPCPRHLLCLPFKAPWPRPHVANIPAPFHAPLPLLCSIKQQRHAKPDRALLHRVAVLSDLFATCLACHCFAASRRGCPRQGLDGPGSLREGPRAWREAVEKASGLACSGPCGLMAIRPEERTFSGQVSEAGQGVPFLPVLSVTLEKRRRWERSGVG